MLDFTSSLYLGFRHPSASLPAWDAFETLGRPAALQEPPGAAAVAAGLAALQGCEAGTLMPSTLHLFLDLFRMLGRSDAMICIEATAYAIARWGVQHGAAPSTPVYTFPAGDAAALERLLGDLAARRRRPLIVCDALWPGRNRQPPLPHYAALAARHGGYLVLDDTQGLGLLGAGSDSTAPLGRGGGGTLRHYNLGGGHIVVGASLAKGFGVPVAVLSGSVPLVRQFKEGSQTRVHTSPPSVAVIHAAIRALALNRQYGDRLRQRLAQLVLRFRERVARLGLSATGGAFPVQTLTRVAGIDAAVLHAGLLKRRVRTVLHGGAGADGARISFIFTTAKTMSCIDRAVDALAETVRSLNGHAVMCVPMRRVS